MEGDDNSDCSNIHSLDNDITRGLDRLSVTSLTSVDVQYDSSEEYDSTEDEYYSDGYETDESLVEEQEEESKAGNNTNDIDGIQTASATAEAVKNSNDDHISEEQEESETKVSEEEHEDIENCNNNVVGIQSASETIVGVAKAFPIDVEMSEEKK